MWFDAFRQSEWGEEMVVAEKERFKNITKTRL
jgi:hypothetical protein